MLPYSVGILFGLLGGTFNFLGQVIQKKAINDTAAEKRENALMKSLTKNPIWITGLLVMIGAGVFQMLGQNVVGAAVMPGLMASGFIVLAIGSVKILKETLKFAEYIAIGLLIVAVTLIGLSELSITYDVAIFQDSDFDIRLTVATLTFTILWLGLYYTGKKVKKYKSIFLALGTGFPFVVGNLWLQPFLGSLVPVFSGSAETVEWVIFFVGLIYVAVGNMFGIIHYQNALNAGKASIITPVQQMPQQIAPIITFYVIYQLASPKVYSLPFLIVAISLIITASFLLAQRQVALEKIKN